MTVTVGNNIGDNIVLLSPNMPAPEVDSRHCALEVSTVIDDRVRPCEFTPKLVTVFAGRSMQFRANLKPLILPDRCREWNVTAEYEYITPAEVESGVVSRRQREDNAFRCRRASTRSSVSTQPMACGLEREALTNRRFSNTSKWQYRRYVRHLEIANERA